MKTKTIITTCLMMFAATSGFSQIDSSGIYFTASDYTLQKLSLSINCKTEKHKIRPDMIFHSKEIIIIHHGVTYKYSKDSVYAIKNCDNSIDRIFNYSQYPVINPGEQIIIYKVIQAPTGKGETEKTLYYFSKNAIGAIEELTINNIKLAFPDNHKFHDLIDMNFHNKDELTAYDNFHKMMKINRVFQNSIETKDTNEKSHH